MSSVRHCGTKWDRTAKLSEMASNALILLANGLLQTSRDVGEANDFKSTQAHFGRGVSYQ
jgi:hypothetical protein